MKSLTSIARVGATVLPALFLAGMGAKALISPVESVPQNAIVPQSQMSILNSTSVTAAAAPAAVKIETAGASDSSATVSMALPVILPVRSPVRP